LPIIYSIYVLLLFIMTTPVSRSERTQAMMRGHAAIRWRDLAKQGVTPATIARLVDSGDVERLARGLYRLVAHESGAYQSLAEIAKMAPNGVICLGSALHWHGLTTQLPQAVWLMIAHKARPPTRPVVRLNVVRASGDALTFGVEQFDVDGVKVAITNPAKTVADCFKYRSRIGFDVAIEALREGLSTRAFTPDTFLEMATINRVARVVRPYLEAMV
jgi:predicted transcriptional regulator of viral defense system